MKILEFSIFINAPKETVWEILFTDRNYPKWASVFCEGANIVTDWKKGNSVQFTTPDGQGTFGIIENVIPHKLMAFRHLGVMMNGENLDDEKNSEWENIKESYHFKENSGQTKLILKIDDIPNYTQFFEEKLPLALVRIKELSEIE